MDELGPPAAGIAAAGPAAQVQVEERADVCSLHFMYRNFGRPHMTLTKRAGGVRATPAMAAGVADHIWSLVEIAALLDVNRDSH